MLFGCAERLGRERRLSPPSGPKVATDTPELLRGRGKGGDECHIGAHACPGLGTLSGNCPLPRHGLQRAVWTFQAVLRKMTE